MTPALKTKLELALGSAVVEARPLPVGFGLTGLDVTLADRRRLAVKALEQTSGRNATLDLEGYMLGELARLSDLPVPLVHHAAPDLLVMDFIDNDGGAHHAERRAPCRGADRRAPCHARASGSAMRATR